MHFQYHKLINIKMCYFKSNFFFRSFFFQQNTRRIKHDAGYKENNNTTIEARNSQNGSRCICVHASFVPRPSVWAYLAHRDTFLGGIHDFTSSSMVKNCLPFTKSVWSHKCVSFITFMCWTTWNLRFIFISFSQLFRFRILIHIWKNN